MTKNMMFHDNSIETFSLFEHGFSKPQKESHEMLDKYSYLSGQKKSSLLNRLGGDCYQKCFASV